jgi:hypothetical protein
MAQDPRLDSLMQYAMSAVGAGPTDDSAVLRQRIENLERLVAVVLRTPNVQTGAPPATERSTSISRTVACTSWRPHGASSARCPRRRMATNEPTVVDVQQTLLQAVHALAQGVVFGVQGAQRAAQTDAQQASAYVAVAAQAARACNDLGSLLLEWQKLPVKNPKGLAPDLYDPAPAPAA